LRAESVAGLSPDDATSRRLLIELAQSRDRPLRDEALRSLRGASLDPSERNVLAKVVDGDGTNELVARVLRPNESPPRPAAGDLPGWLKFVGGGAGSPAGDAEAGERIFFNRRSAGCSKCHQMLGRGARVGPELTAASGGLSRTRLIESIVRPGQEIAPQFASWLVVTTDGKSFSGVLVNEEATGEQTYADQDGQLRRFTPREIEARKLQATSIMPDGLAHLLTAEEFRDLLAYLVQQEAAR
jgi:putative heme-binding domain-containing protein